MRRRASRGEDTGLEEDEQSTAGAGLLGLGDDDYALAGTLFNHFAYAKGFMADGAAEFRKKHSDLRACATIEPKAKVFRQCGACCIESAMSEHGFSKDSFDQAKNLLFLINGKMKDLYGAIKKQITVHTKHPLLFVRMLYSDGSWMSRGWLLTRAMFKPRTVAGVSVYPLDPDSTLDSPFVAYMDIQTVHLSSLQIPDFVCIDGIAAEIAVLKQLCAHDEDAKLQYCFNPAYTLSCTQPLTHLTITEILHWVTPGHIEYEPSDDEGDNDVDELDDFDEMIASLISHGASATGTGNKPKGSKSKSSAQSKKPSSGSVCVGGVILLVFCLVVYQVFIS